MDLLEKVVSKENMHAAYKAVWRNQGSSGVDGMELDELLFYLTRNWESIKEIILNGKYYPQAILGVEIDKETGDKVQKTSEYMSLLQIIKNYKSELVITAKPEKVKPEQE